MREHDNRCDRVAIGDRVGAKSAIIDAIDARRSRQVLERSADASVLADHVLAAGTRVDGVLAGVDAERNQAAAEPASVTEHTVV